MRIITIFFRSNFSNLSEKNEIEIVQMWSKQSKIVLCEHIVHVKSVLWCLVYGYGAKLNHAIVHYHNRKLPFRTTVVGGWGVGGKASNSICTCSKGTGAFAAEFLRNSEFFFCSLTKTFIILQNSRGQVTEYTHTHQPLKYALTRDRNGVAGKRPAVLPSSDTIERYLDRWISHLITT